MSSPGEGAGFLPMLRGGHAESLAERHSEVVELRGLSLSEDVGGCRLGFRGLPFTLLALQALPSALGLGQSGELCGVMLNLRRGRQHLGNIKTLFYMSKRRNPTHETSNDFEIWHVH